MKPLGAIVTFTGRELIERSKEYAEGSFLDYIKENNTIMYTIKQKVLDIPEQQRSIILEQFKN